MLKHIFEILLGRISFVGKEIIRHEPAPLPVLSFAHTKLQERSSVTNPKYEYTDSLDGFMTVREFLNHARGFSYVKAKNEVYRVLAEKLTGVGMAQTAKAISRKNGVKVLNVKVHYKSTFSDVKTYHPNVLCEVFEQKYGTLFTEEQLDKILVI